MSNEARMAYGPKYKKQRIRKISLKVLESGGIVKIYGPAPILDFKIYSAL